MADSSYALICGSGCGTDSSSQFSHDHIQRPGLLWLSSAQSGQGHNEVYVAFSMMDGTTTNPNGWIWGYNAQNLSQTPLSYLTTPETNGQRGGIWQGAAGLAAGTDSSGGNTYIYFSTADGDFDLDTGGTNASDSLIKLSTSLTIPGGSYSSSNFFTPSDQCWRQGYDQDFGSGGVMLLPDNLISGHPYLTIKSEKENWLWVVDRGTPGGYSAGNCPAPTGGLICRSQNNNPCTSDKWSNSIVQARQINKGQDSHTTPAFWAGNTSGSQNGWVFFAAMGDYLKGYPIDPTNCGVLCAATASMTTPMNLGYSATPAVSSGPTYANGIVWAIKNVTGAVGLYAFDATNLATELYDSSKCHSPGGGVPLDLPGNPTRFSVPTIANGYVYIATENDFDVYGQLAQSRTCQ